MNGYYLIINTDTENKTYYSIKYFERYINTNHEYLSTVIEHTTDKELIADYFGK